MSPVLMIASTRYPSSSGNKLLEIPRHLSLLTLDWEHAELEPLGHGTAPWLELHPEVVTLSWDTELVFISEVRLGAHQWGWPGAGWSCSWRRLSWTGPCQTETQSERRSSPGAETVCKGDVTGSSGSGVTWAKWAALSWCGQATLSTCTPHPSGEYSLKLSK